MQYIPHAASLRLYQLADGNEKIRNVYSEIEAALIENLPIVSVDVMDLNLDEKKDLSAALEQLGYVVDEAYGEELFHISLT